MDAEGNAAGDTSATFTNGYEAAPVTLKLGAAKVLKGAKLKAGQFSFELKSRDGKVMSTAKNAADGSVTFDALTFKQAGTYTFTVSEVDDGRAHVTYDKAVHKIVVTVGDEAADGTKTGYLSAKVSYEGDANVPPVFTNSYAENPGTPGTPRTPARRAAARAAVQITAPAAAPAATAPRAACPTPATAACRSRRSAPWPASAR